MSDLVPTTSTLTSEENQRSLSEEESFSDGFGGGVREDIFDTQQGETEWKDDPYTSIRRRLCRGVFTQQGEQRSLWAIGPGFAPSKLNYLYCGSKDGQRFTTYERKY